MHMTHGSHDLASRRRRTIAMVLGALDIVLHRLEGLEPTPDVNAIRVTALDHMREVQEWERAWPPLEAQERLMKRVLDLRTHTARLEVSAPRAMP
jgi:hypothetical protein